jgi:hypothetical protein
MKRCSTCKKLKPHEDFNRRSAATGGRQWNCRACNSEYHRLNKERHNAQIHARKRRVRSENQRLLLDYLREHPCVDCGEADPVVLEFDHVRDKVKPVSFLLGQGHDWPRIVEEIEKCEVRCANCHRRRTAIVGGFYRTRPLAE